MNKLKNPMGRLGRLFHRLQDVDHVEILYVPGFDNMLPDFLSRSFESVDSELNNIELQSIINWEKEQSLDSNLQQIINLVKSNPIESEWLKIQDGKRWVRERKNLFLSNGILKHSYFKTENF